MLPQRPHAVSSCSHQGSPPAQPLRSCPDLLGLAAGMCCIVPTARCRVPSASLLRLRGGRAPPCGRSGPRSRPPPPPWWSPATRPAHRHTAPARQNPEANRKPCTPSLQALTRLARADCKARGHTLWPGWRVRVGSLRRSRGCRRDSHGQTAARGLPTARSDPSCRSSGPSRAHAATTRSGQRSAQKAAAPAAMPRLPPFSRPSLREAASAVHKETLHAS
jgi:hypothetical protein